MAGLVSTAEKLWNEKDGSQMIEVVNATIVVIKDSAGEVRSILAVPNISRRRRREFTTETHVKSTASNAPYLFHKSRSWGLQWVKDLEASGRLRLDYGLSGPSFMLMIPGIPALMNGQENDKGIHCSIYNKPAPGKDYSTTGGTILVNFHAKKLAELEGKVVQLALHMN